MRDQIQDQAGSAALTVWPQRLIKETYFQKSNDFQWFCKIAFWDFFTLFVTASKLIELQKSD